MRLCNLLDKIFPNAAISVACVPHVSEDPGFESSSKGVYDLKLHSVPTWYIQIPNSLLIKYQ